MELLSALRLLARRPLVLAVGVLVGAVLGAVGSGKVALGPFGGPETRTAIAAADVQIDTPRPVAADLRASTAAIDSQAIMLAERLAADDTRKIVARKAGVAFEDLTIASSRTAIVGRTNAIARAAVDAAATTQTPYRLTVSSTSEAPIVSVVATAPGEATAVRLAVAAAPALQSVIDAAPESVKKRLVVAPLAPPQTDAVVSGGPKPMLGVLAAALGFVGWCWFVLVAGGAVRALSRPGRPRGEPRSATP